MSENVPLIRFSGVSKSYNKDPLQKGGSILDGLDLVISRGERVAVVGPNGSGKSTLMQLALGLLPPDVGTIEFTGGARHFIPQDYRSAVFPWLKLRKHLDLFLVRQLAGAASDDAIGVRFTALAANLEIEFDLEKYPYQLSGGEQQIFLLICALLRNPDLLVLDEALSAVDFHRREVIFGTLTRWIDDNVTTLLCVDHDVEQAIALSDRLLVLSRDRTDIVADIPVTERQPRHFDWKFSPACRSYLERITEFFHAQTNLK